MPGPQADHSSDPKVVRLDMDCPSDADKDYAQELREFIAELYQRPGCEAVALEIEGEDASNSWYVDVRVLKPDIQ